MKKQTTFQGNPFYQICVLPHNQPPLRYATTPNPRRLRPAHQVSISLYTPQGQLSKQYTAPGGATLQLATDTLPLGIYYCHIQVNGQAPQTQKLVIIR
ncbi:MAG TPA: T9SS type A sorting domain-containing protein [Chitinophagales bacterium]|nr:T9SS type A sorting domain-containing protein [Chitinophagales bacterium]